MFVKNNCDSRTDQQVVHIVVNSSGVQSFETTWQRALGKFWISVCWHLRQLAGSFLWLIT